MHVQCTLVLFLAFTAVVMLEAPKGAKPLCEAGKSYSYHTIGICTNISICPFFNRANSPPGTKRPSVRPRTIFRIASPDPLVFTVTQRKNSRMHVRKKALIVFSRSLANNGRLADVCGEERRGEERRALEDNCERESGRGKVPHLARFRRKTKCRYPNKGLGGGGGLEKICFIIAFARFPRLYSPGHLNVHNPKKPKITPKKEEFAPGAYNKNVRQIQKCAHLSGQDCTFPEKRGLF